ncbi:DUF2878 domain-containing protein [Alishewanella sp. 16-MA]|uniref:DUF2878 domain-containing protein n=1 Tax=Alishewanella maricola TaxID=2795740 RepID=A0ABS8C0G6_9ALTE|nr:DUF2878 domain-containing protein [Alishewanella maricola]MCB5225803.1 DUF2878 domain-containing protein [Alishewanella maricola]
MSSVKVKLNWRVLIGFELSWFLLVYFQQLAFWPVLAYLLYGLWQLPSMKARYLVLAAAILGISVDSLLVATGILSFAQLAWLPLWFILLWAIFALALVEVMSRFLTKPWLGFSLGATGGPLSYIGGAALSDGVMSFPSGVTSYIVLCLVWGLLGVIFGKIPSLLETSTAQELNGSAQK